MLIFSAAPKNSPDNNHVQYILLVVFSEDEEHRISGGGYLLLVEHYVATHMNERVACCDFRVLTRRKESLQAPKKNTVYVHDGFS